MSESLVDLEARLKLLQAHRVAEHDPATGRVVFFAPERIGIVATPAEMAELAARREQVAADARRRTTFGASGGMLPGGASPANTASAIAGKAEFEKASALRDQRRMAKIAGSQAKLDQRKAG